jgi:L-threonylcarbamoyladenylate synthase
VSREQIEAVTGTVDVAQVQVKTGRPAASPGQQEMHYAPTAPAFRFSGSLFTDTAGGAVLLVGARRRLRVLRDVHVLELPGTPQAFARDFYAALRELDALNPRAIFVEMPPDEPGWEAVRDRVIRATKPLR